MFKPIAKEIKEQVLNRIKTEGVSVAEAARQHGISPKTIYGWLHKGVEGVGSTVLENNRLKKENQKLKEIIGNLVLKEERGKKD